MLIFHLKKSPLDKSKWLEFEIRTGTKIKIQNFYYYLKKHHEICLINKMKKIFARFGRLVGWLGSMTYQPL